jgi:hypothetical protein
LHYSVWRTAYGKGNCTRLDEPTRVRRAPPNSYRPERAFPFSISSVTCKTIAAPITRVNGLGQLEFGDFLERAPLMVPVNALGYNYFVVFRGVMGNRVLLADPAWGNRTMTIDKFQRMWLDYVEPMSHVGFAITPAGGRKLPNRLQPNRFVTFG